MQATATMFVVWPLYIRSASRAHLENMGVRALVESLTAATTINFVTEQSWEWLELCILMKKLLDSHRPN